MIRVLLDGVEISNNIEVDLSFVEKLDRELDEGFLVISHTDRKDQFPMYSSIDILEDNYLIFSGRVSSDMVELSSFSDDVYNHNVSLIEHTKLLEKYLVSGKTFTQPIGNVGVPLYTLFDVVEILRTTALFEKEGQQDTFAPFIIPNETKEELENIISPEFSFKDVTLRQSLDEVANVLDSITRLTRDNEIIFDKFNELLDQIDGITENYKKQQNVDGYSTILSSEIINPISRGKDSLRESEYYPGKHLWTTLRSNFGQFDFENSYIPTPKPIYEILETNTLIKIKISEGVDDEPQNANLILEDDVLELDLSENIVEKSKYDTLPTLVGTTGIVDGYRILPQQQSIGRSIENGFFNVLDRRTVLIYEYGKKNIQVGKTYGIFNIQVAYRNAVENAIFRFIKKFTNDNSLLFDIKFPDTPINRFFSTKDNKFYFVEFNLLGSLDAPVSFERWRELFRVKYVPIPPSIRYEVVRDDVSEVDFYTTQTINQKLRIVDLEAFANNMKGRINQISESQLTLSHKVKNINQSFKIGDFTAERFVVTKKEVIVQRDHYIINYELNKNFNKISQFLGIDQEIRQWEIGESGRTLDRDLNYNEYIEIEADDTGSFNILNNETTFNKPELFLSTFDSTATAKPYSFATFSSEDLVYEDGTPITLNLPLYKVSGGDSFGIYFDFDSNASSGNELQRGESGIIVNLLDEALRRLRLLQGIARYFNVPVKYTDDIGRLDTFNISLYNEDIGRSVEDYILETNDANLLPIFTRTITEEPVNFSTFHVKKDNRERIKMTLQYHILSKDITEVVVGNKLSTHNFFFIETPNNVELRTFKNRKFTKRDKNKELTGFENKYTTNFLTIDNQNLFIEITQDLSDVDSWALTDENGLPFVMVNGNKKRLVFNFTNKRDGLRYLRTGFDEIYRPPILVSSSETDSTITITLHNPNDETVIIESFLSVRLQDGVQIETVAPNSDVTFTFTGLEQNNNYTFLTVCNNVNPSIGFSGNGKKNSLRKSYTLKTDVLPLDPPGFFINMLIRETFEILETEEGITQFDIEGPSALERYNVGFSITNSNNLDLIPIIEIDGQITTLGVMGGLSFPQTGGFVPLVVESNQAIIGNQTITNRATLQRFRSGFPGFEFTTPFRLGWRTVGLRNNFEGGFTEVNEINILPHEQPIYVVDGFNAPVITTNSIQVRWNNPNDTQAVIQVEMFSEAGFRVETKTATVNANSNVDINFTGLQQSRTFSFKAKFLEGSGKLESIQVGDPLFTPQDQIIFNTTFDDFGASPIVTRVVATTNSLTIRFINQDSRDVIMSGGFSGSQLEQLGTAQGSGGNIDQTFTGLRAGEKYTFAARVRLVDEVRPAPEEQTTLFETFTRPSRPSVDLIGSPTATNFAARAFNVGNAYPVEIRRDGTLLNPSPVEPGAFADVLVTGLAPSSSNTFAFVSRLDGLNSATTTINVNTLGPLVNPVVTVESATFNSITPRIQNNNNRMVRAFGRFFPTNLSDLGLLTSGNSNIGLTFSDDFLQANRPLTFYSKFVDPIDITTETSVVQSTLHTAPLRAQDVIIEQVITSSNSIVSISLSFFNPNNQFGPNLNAIVSVFQGGGLEGSTTINNITPNFTTSANLTSLQMNNDDFFIIIQLQNPTSSSETEFYHEI